MDFKNKADYTKNEFSKEFELTLSLLMTSYPRFRNGKFDDAVTEDVARYALGTILLNVLRQIQVDSCEMISTDFHKKYIPNLPVLDCSDFSIDERKQIVNDALLNDRDKQIAYKKFVEMKNDAEIYDEMLEIENKKTIPNNIDKISDALKYAALIFNNKK